MTFSGHPNPVNETYHSRNGNYYWSYNNCNQSVLFREFVAESLFILKEQWLAHYCLYEQSAHSQ